MEWKIVEERPGYFGKKRDEKFREYDEKYGKNNWRVAWKWGNTAIDFFAACKIYEDAYYEDSFKREELWKSLVEKANDVYDIEESNIKSGLDYLVQENNATHIQDIAIRRVVLRRGWNFWGDELIRIRHHDNYWGANLSPGKVLFHMPEMIAVPHLEGWWDYNSVEDFYQSNKIVQVKQE